MKSKTDNNLRLERKVKLQVLDFPEWKKNSTCFVFSVRPKGIDPDTQPTWSLDSWFKVDYGNLNATSDTISMIKLRARMNIGHVYAVWLPNELVESIEKDDNPEDYMELIMKHKFKI